MPLKKGDIFPVQSRYRVLCGATAVFSHYRSHLPLAAAAAASMSPRLAGRSITATYKWTGDVITALYSTLLDPYGLAAFTGRKTHPAACVGFTCNALCGGHCWDESLDGCQRCPTGEVLAQGTCVAEDAIPDGFYRKDWIALACDDTCATCSGPSDGECTSCSGSRYLLASLGACVTNCGTGYFAGSDNRCQPCHASVRQLPTDGVGESGKIGKVIDR